MLEEIICKFVPLGNIKKKLQKNFEITFITGAIFSWIIGIKIWQLPIILPDKQSIGLLFYHYLLPLIYALMIQILIIVLRHLLKKPTKYKRGDLLIILGYIPLIFVTVILHFNFKAWMPLVNPVLFDNLYAKIDSLVPIASTLESLSVLLHLNTTGPALYHGLFVLMFFLSFIIHLSFDSFINFRKVVVGTCLILLLGSFSYWIAPAIGPFILKKPTLSSFSVYQGHMYSLYLSLKSTGIPPVGYFSNAPAAMPSLHIANSFFFLAMAKRNFPILNKIYFLFLGYIVIVAVGSGWHYFIDLIGGLLLSLIVINIIDKVIVE